MESDIQSAVVAINLMSSSAASTEYPKCNEQFHVLLLNFIKNF